MRRAWIAAAGIAAAAGLGVGSLVTATDTLWPWPSGGACWRRAGVPDPSA